MSKWNTIKKILLSRLDESFKPETWKKATTGSVEVSINEDILKKFLNKG